MFTDHNHPSPFIARPFAAIALALATSLTAGCAGHQAFREGQAELNQGRFEQALGKLRQAVDESPQNAEFRKAYFTQRDVAVNTLLRQMDLAADAGEFDASREAQRQAQRLDPGNARAAAGASRIDMAQSHWTLVESGLALARNGNPNAAIAQVQSVLSENPKHARALLVLKQLMRQQADMTGKDLGIYPKLKAAYRTPVSLSFNNASLQQVFDALKQASGLNYVFDREVKNDARVTLAVTAKPVEDILRLLLATNQLERRVLDEDSLLIYPNTPAKAAEYREMIVRTFYLSNTEAGKMAGVLKTIAKARDVVVDEKLNMLVVRDSAEVIRLAEKLIAAQDLPEPEVMLELEVLEISTNRLVDMGISWPTSISASVSGAAGVPGKLTLDELHHRNSGMVKLNVNDPLVAAQLRSQAGNANLLANPRVRVRNKQSAKILIGERVPVFTTTATANVGTFESVNYLDVGLKLDIEPTVSMDNEVSMKLALEVSNVLEVIARASGTQAYRLGTRNTSTTLRVRDGETNVLAGLIQRDERRSNTGVPGLNEVPVLNKLFGASQDTDTRTEIVLLITPHIVRNIELPGLGLQEFMSGTDASIGAAPIQLGAPGRTAINATVGLPTGATRPPMPSPTPQLGAPPLPPSPPVTLPPTAPPAFTPPPLIPTAPGTTREGSQPVRQPVEGGG